MLQLLAALCTLQLYKVRHSIFLGLPTAERECISRFCPGECQFRGIFACQLCTLTRKRIGMVRCLSDSDLEEGLKGSKTTV